MPAVRFAPLLLLLPAAVSAQSMNAEAFHKRAHALMARGPLAMFSSDLKPLMNEGKAAGAGARAARLAAVKAGKSPRYCPPEGKKGMGSDEFMKGLAAIPAAERASIDMTEAMTRILAHKYPCTS